MLAIRNSVLFFLVLISSLSARTTASPVASAAEIQERQTSTTSYTNSEIVFMKVPPSNLYAADYATYGELESSAGTANIQSSIESTITGSFPQYYQLLGEDGDGTLYGVGGSGGVYTSLYCNRMVDGINQELLYWYGYEDTHINEYAESVTNGFMSQLSNTDTIEACGILLDENWNVLLVLLVAMSWNGQEGYAFGSDEAENKMNACYNAYQSGS